MHCLFAPKRLFRLSHALLVCAGFLPGCQPVAPSSAATVPPTRQTDTATDASRQLMVKFKPDTISCDAAGIARLSAESRTPLEFVRPMSGAACVIRSTLRGEDDLLQAERALRRHPAVEWVDLDRRKKAR